MRSLATLLAVCSIAASTPAIGQNADNITLYRSGQWEVYSANLRTDRPLCGISISDRSDGRTLHFKWTVGTSHIYVVAFRPSWSIPRDLDIPIRLTIDGYSWNATAGSVDSGDGVWFHISRNEVENFERRFRLGSYVRLIFPTGNEVPWGMSLAGTNQAMSAFVGCMRALNDRSGPSQPHSRAPAAPTQPFRRDVPTSDPMPGTAPRRT